MEIQLCTNSELSNLIEPDFIYNRFDLFALKHIVLRAMNYGKEYFITVAFNDKEAKMGIWLMNLPGCVLDNLVDYIFDNYKNIKTITYSNGYLSRGVSWTGHHYRIELPHSVDELHLRLSKKGRYNIKREKNIIINKFGCYAIEEYPVEKCPHEIIELYFQFKYQTHHKKYHLSPRQYLEQFHVTNVYVLRMGIIVGAIIMSCEQCQHIYIENLSYNIKYSNLSCGQVLYDLYLSKLIEKGHKSLYLAGGNLDYKKRYGSIEEKTFNCRIYRNKYYENFLKMLLAIKNTIRRVK